MKLGIVYHMPFWRAEDGTLREVEGSFARYVDSLAPYFDEVLLSVPVLDRPSGEGTAIRSPNVRLDPLPFFDGPSQFYPALPAMLPRIARFVRKVDVVHCRVPTPAAVFAFAAARLIGRRTFLLVVGDLRALLPTLPYRGARRALWRAYTEVEERSVQWMVNRSLTFANGPALTAKHSRPRHAVVETRTSTIHAGDIATRQDICREGPVRLLTVSRIDPRKGLRVLPAMVNELVQRGADVLLDIIGPVVGSPGEAERSAIVDEAAALGLAGRIRMIGAVPLDLLLGLYGTYDGFVLPTGPGEGIPRVLLESMTAGTPVVTTRVAGIPGLVTDGVNGLLVEPTARALADAITRLMADGTLRRRLIACGYETARSFTLESQAARMMQTMSETLGVALRGPDAASAA